MVFSIKFLSALMISTFAAAATFAQVRSVDAVPNAVAGVPCTRAAEGSTIPEPQNLRSEKGLLEVDLFFRSYVDASGQMRYCLVSRTGAPAPTLRLLPGDMLVLRLKNEAVVPAAGPDPNATHSFNHSQSSGKPSPHREVESKSAPTDACSGGPMNASATNLHFHGLIIPATCHADETLKTLVQPADPPFEYRFQIPANQPPGLYWYHPHVHGVSRAQVLGGASGALIVEGIESVDSELAGLPERVLVIRDENLHHPDAQPPKATFPPEIMKLDPEGDFLNTGTGTGKPAKDLSVNYVSVPYPDYPPAVIQMKPSQRELWRVANASAITYVNLQVLFRSAPQPLGVVALDGAPLGLSGDTTKKMLKVSHLVIPPGGRAEFVLSGPPENVEASLVTLSVDTGPLGENDPRRALATIRASQQAVPLQSRLAEHPQRLPAAKTEWIGKVTPVRERKLYFSERQEDPKDPNSPTTFFVTVDGETPRAFDPSSPAPNMTAQQGTVEDWIVENRTQEFHAFHVHQVHFLLTEWNGRAVDEPFLRDTVNVDYWDGKNAHYPSIKVRLDLRDPNVVGLLPYHCHLLEHQDNGMMGVLLVKPSLDDSASK
jgi:FtsP/CotA-like multicopper oxidase with cupredoxin domain